MTITRFRARSVRGALALAVGAWAASAPAAMAAMQTFSYSGSIVNWTVPTTGLYRLTAVGANAGLNGRGASVAGDLTLTAGTQLSILVGGKGGFVEDTPGIGGGGGTFIVGPGNTPILVAGGGGGAGGNLGHGRASAAPVPDGSGGASGIGGDGGIGAGGGGGGFYTSGGTEAPGFLNPGPGQGGASFVLGGAGGGAGTIAGYVGAVGGFGGGGGSGGGGYSAGGGGGYNGGRGADPGPAMASLGGTSFFAPAMTNLFGVDGGNTRTDGFGYAEIALIPAPSAAALLGLAGLVAIRRRR
ncbi:MAG: hypothetical protein IBJ11_09080 [Phycisphaerales bacterium]|nr:hypothetical protein [Phycisphaerales bacterium]